MIEERAEYDGELTPEIPGHLPEHAQSDAVVPVTLLKPPPGAGLTMVDGDAVGMCEGDACFVPSLVRKNDAG